MIKREDYEVEGPIITQEVANDLFRTVMDPRHVQEFERRGVIEFVHEVEDSRFRVCAMKENGNVRLDFTLVTA